MKSVKYILTILVVLQGFLGCQANKSAEDEDMPENGDTPEEITSEPLDISVPEVEVNPADIPDIEIEPTLF